jgi:hypothetical protein
MLLLLLLFLPDFLGLPVPKAQARELLTLQKAGEGGGGQAGGAGSGGRSVTLHSSMLSIDNPAWEEALDKLINEQLRQELGLTCSLTKDLTGLSLYEAGCTYSEERCAREDGKIRLLITLQSLHKGGNLVLSDLDKSVVALGGYEAVLQGTYEPHFCAFYSDCQQELEEVTQV